MKIKIPNFSRIIKPNWSHKAGYGISSEKGNFIKQKVKSQGTIPSDKKLLGKLNINKKDKILAIATYYGDWVSAFKNFGAEVDYSDISRSMVNYVIKNVKTKFRKYICLGYEYLPKKSNEYDWTFTYEACGGEQGLPIAYLRSLLNNKGGILVLFINIEKLESMGGKLRTYPNIVKILAKIYSAKNVIKIVKIRARKKNENIYKNYNFLVCWIKTNNSARKEAEKDTKILDSIKDKKVISLGEESRKLNISKKDLLGSLNRISQLTKLVKKEFIKEIIVK